MKKIICLMMLVGSTAQAADSCSYPGKYGKARDCEVVAVVTRCDVAKQKLQHRINELQKRLKELEARQTTVVNYPTLTVVEDHYVKKTVVEKETAIKHNILAVYMARDIHATDVTQTSSTVQTAYEPGIKYQYQFNMGLVPEVGINIKGNPMFGLGFEF